MIDRVNLGHMSQAELEKETQRLKAKMERKEGTILDANRLADIERTLRRIETVAAGRAW